MSAAAAAVDQDAALLALARSLSEHIESALDDLDSELADHVEASIIGNHDLRHTIGDRDALRRGLELTVRPMLRQSVAICERLERLLA